MKVHSGRVISAFVLTVFLSLSIAPLAHASQRRWFGDDPGFGDQFAGIIERVHSQITHVVNCLDDLLGPPHP